MYKQFENIKSIGFDLDDTLYPSSKKIDERIVKVIAEKILYKKPELNSINNAMNFYQKRRMEIGSGKQVLMEIGYEEAAEIMNECMIKADFTDLLKKNFSVIRLLRMLTRKYSTFLITGASKKLALLRLEKLGIESSFFNYLIFSDSLNGNKKIDGSVFKYYLTISPYNAEEHVYIGDNITSDILPAKSVGMKTILVGDNSHLADYCVKNFTNIKKLLL